jgi:hypothetical protein
LATATHPVATFIFKALIAIRVATRSSSAPAGARRACHSKSG